MESEIGQQRPLKIIGSIALLSSIVQLGCALAVYTAISSPNLGAWWAASLNLICSLICIGARSKYSGILACITACIAVLVGFIGSVADGMFAALVHSFEDCGSMDSPTVDMFLCSTDTSKYDCTCTVNHDLDTACYYFDGPAIRGGKCDYIESTWIHNLDATSSFDSITLLLIFALSITTCVGLCCSSAPIVPENLYVDGRASATPAVVVMPPAASYQQPVTFPAAANEEAVVTLHDLRPQYMQLMDSSDNAQYPVAQAVYIAK